MDLLLTKSNPPLRQRRQRTNFSEQVIDALEDAFTKNPYPDINERESLALQFKTTEDRVQVWFQNKRARYRKRMQKENNSKSANDTNNLKVENESLSIETTPSRILQTNNHTKAQISSSSSPSISEDSSSELRFSSPRSGHDSGIYESSPSITDSNRSFLTNSHFSSPLLGHSNLNHSLSLNSSNFLSSPYYFSSANYFQNFQPIYNFTQNVSAYISTSSKLSPLVLHGNLTSTQISQATKTRAPKAMFKPYE